MANSINLQLRQPIHDFHRLNADRDHPLEKFHRIAWVAYRLVGVVVRVVHDAAVFVCLHHLPFHHPFQRWFAVYDVVVGGEGDVLHRDVVVIDHSAAVFFFAFAAEFHLGHAVELLRVRLRLGD